MTKRRSNIIPNKTRQGRPTAPVVTLRKILGTVVATKTNAFFEEHGVLPYKHMAAHQGTTTNIALLILIKHVHARWQIMTK